MYKITKNLATKTQQKAPRLSGEEENKKKNKLKGHVVRT